MAGMVKRVAPLSYEAWIDYDVEGAHLSRGEIGALRALLDANDDGIRARAGGALDAQALAAHDLSAREARELIAKLQPRARPDFELDLTRIRPPEEIEARMQEAVPKPDRQTAEPTA